MKRAKKRAGFSLTEIMVALTILTSVIAGATITFIMGLRAYRAAAAESDAATGASTAIARIAYGIGNSCGLRAAFTPVSTLSGNNGWSITFSVPKGISGNSVEVNHLKYDKDAKTISYKGGDNQPWTVIGKHIVDSTISAGQNSITIVVKAQAIVGNMSTINEKKTTIAFRN